MAAPGPGTPAAAVRGVPVTSSRPAQLGIPRPAELGIVRPPDQAALDTRGAVAAAAMAPTNGPPDVGGLPTVDRGPVATAVGAAALAGETYPFRDVSSEGGSAAQAHPGCTAAQLRRFIKSRAYVPLHELRRRFELDGAEDDVSAVEVDGHRLFVGLPPRESQLLGELLRSGDVGYELLLDPTSPLVVGVFPMRPVPRA